MSTIEEDIIRRIMKGENEGDPGPYPPRRPKIHGPDILAPETDPRTPRTAPWVKTTHACPLCGDEHEAPNATPVAEGDDFVGSTIDEEWYDDQ